jgi:hypothetical protein
MHIYEVRPRKDKRGFDLISRCAATALRIALDELPQGFDHFGSRLDAWCRLNLAA